MIQGIPAKPDTYYFGASGGGVWRPDDAGQTWTSLFGGGGSSAIGAIAIAPSNSQVIYIGGGQPEPRYDVQSGRGIYKSIDGGKSWADLGLHDTRYIGRIWVNPTDPNIVVVGAVGHFFGPSEARGVYRSTDGGRTWSHPLAPGGFTGVNDVVSDPSKPHTLFASTWDARQWPWQSYFTEISGPGSGVWRSDDQGAHWRRLSGAGWPSGPLGRISLAATRKAGKLRVYAVIDSKANGGLWRSDDGGAHWVRVNSEKAFASYYFNRVTVDPRNPDVVYLVGQSMRRCDPVGGDERDYDIPDPTDPNIVFGSGLGGRVSRWDARTGEVTDVSPWPVQNYGLRPTTVAHHFNWVTPLVASRVGPPSLYLGGDVIFKTSDRGASWRIISPDLVGKRAGAQRCDGDVTPEDALPCGYGTITAIEPSPRSAAELWTGSDTGIVS